MDLIKEINEKYLVLETAVDKKLEKIKREEEKLGKWKEQTTEVTDTTDNKKILSYEEAMARNALLLKSLEMAKARLRSKSTFSPVEQLLEKAISNYKQNLEALTTPLCPDSIIQPQKDRHPTIGSESFDGCTSSYITHSELRHFSVQNGTEHNQFIAKHTK